MRGHRFAKETLREFDIRGLLGVNISEKDAYHIGRCLGSLVADRAGSRVVVARDNSDEVNVMLPKLAQGLLECGMEVIDIGKVSKDVLRFAEYFLHANGSVMIDKDRYGEIGFTLSLEGEEIIGQDIKFFSNLAKTGIYAESKMGFVRKQDITENYVQSIVKEFKENHHKIKAEDKIKIGELIEKTSFYLANAARQEEGIHQA